ncbi:MAG TPA: 16S rRNA (guanine(527)-N(7))-methyltransferase RsmG [Vicinamibacterales bacterium]|nr:16S rRNA (guanine(527)-N(7))-methyltransferase RsmG [Vicinamibacterales bacterium]
MTSKEFTQRLTRRAKRAGVPVAPELAQKLWVYFDLLFRWNTKINLTSLSPEKPDEAIDRLIIEPLVAATELMASGLRHIDIGSGGGSPALPIKLAAPQTKLVMVESKARKSAFLREALRHLAIDAAVETARFEELLARPDLHEAFDALTMRAVKTEAKTLASLQAFVRPGGRILLFRRAGSERQPAWLAPPLRSTRTIPLIPGSELAVLEKLRIP